MKKILLVFVIILLFLSCAHNYRFNMIKTMDNMQYDNIKFIVISDPHVYNTILGQNTKEFNHYLDYDRKLLIESGEIIDEFLNSIDTINFDFIIISGDLTKDGEYINHEMLINKFQKIINKNIPVLIIPGNHDISNPQSYQYTDTGIVLTKNVTPKEFPLLYTKFGYNNALYRDKNSLSYIYEIKNTWIFALDDCRYLENKKGHEHVIGGKFNNKTLKWIEDKLIEANEKHKAIIVTVHHGVLEHFKGQKKYYPDYVMDNYKNISKMFANYNVRLVFTGHFHANDITMAKYKINNREKTIYDIETGSLITYPCPYRIITIDNNNAHIETRHITKTKSHLNNFKAYSYQYVHSGLKIIAEKVLGKFGVNQNDAKKISDTIAKTIIEHYRGDEIYNKDLLNFKELGLISKIIIHFEKGNIEGMNMDLPPTDNNIDIKLY